MSGTVLQSYLDEAAFRTSQRVCIGTVNRRTRKGKVVSRPDWRRVLVAWQMQKLMHCAVGRQLRSTPDGGLRVLSRVGVLPRAHVDLDVSDFEVDEAF